MKRFALIAAFGIVLLVSSNASAAVAVRVGRVGVRVGRPVARPVVRRVVARPAYVAPRRVVAAPSVAPVPAYRASVHAQRVAAWQTIRDNRQDAYQTILDRQQAIVDALQNDQY